MSDEPTEGVAAIYFHMHTGYLNMHEKRRDTVSLVTPANHFLKRFELDT